MLEDEAPIMWTVTDVSNLTSQNLFLHFGVVSGREYQPLCKPAFLPGEEAFRKVRFGFF